MSGYHKLINSVAFDNKAKGIDSNSCPDIQVTNSTSYNNGGSNVAMYTMMQQIPILWQQVFFHGEHRRQV